MTTFTTDRRSGLLLLASVALIGAPHAWNLPPLLCAFFAVAVAWRLLGVWRVDWLPNRRLLTLLTLLGIALLVSQQRGLFGRDAGTGIFMVALGLKLFEIQSRRDVYLVVYLAFIVAASQFLYSQSLWMAAFIFVVCTLLTTTLVVSTSLTQNSRDAFRKAAVIIAQALPLALLMFVVFPRLDAPRWMWLQQDNRAKSGLSNVLQPGAISELSLSDERVFRARFSGDLPPQSKRYWRGPVYVVTDGTTWTASKTLAPAADIAFGEPVYRYTLMMEPQQENRVYALELAKDLDSDVQRTANFELISRSNPGERAEYALTSATTYNTGALADGERQASLQLAGPVSVRLHELVERLGGFNASPDRFIENLLRHFRDENFYYTLTPPLMPDAPIETFLLESRSGFCSHYATAFAYLMRIAGIPARVVGGYQGGEFNAVGGFLDIRQADAHAWAEVWLTGRGWVRVDPTAAVAPERIERGVNVALQITSGAVNFASSHPPSWPWLQQGRHLWQSLDYNWQRWVIGYDNKSRLQLLQALGIVDWQTLTSWLAVAVLAVTLTLTWLILRRPHRRQDPVLICYRRFCRTLAKRGITPATGEGPLDFADRVKRGHPDLAGAVDAITALFVRLRYQPDASPDDMQALQRAVRNLEV
ncbi:MAG: DUF3488 domain-containing transglutaminase family protein [Methylomonas sp.]|nr:DUF3488 domain-containing transglutaminase family protein [Methylomonas sp.]PPD22208.1 MAG: transglutaminase [Methylomonas sp.]PPD27745.1 MAG: transglutaminase [Methylomonas sp.]PPD39756.1 MAG: transglutaminase [Methylomonas sp.]PPD42529.1 MAG: transglutaminase [Methylomonas sp.]